MLYAMGHKLDEFHGFLETLTSLMPSSFKAFTSRASSRTGVGLSIRFFTMVGLLWYEKRCCTRCRCRFGQQNVSDLLLVQRYILPLHNIESPGQKSCVGNWAVRGSFASAAVVASGVIWPCLTLLRYVYFCQCECFHIDKQGRFEHSDNIRRI